MPLKYCRKFEPPA